MKLRAAILTKLAVLSTCLLINDAALPAQPVEVTGFGSNPGELRMWRYVPDGLPPSSPLVVALHGCMQSAAAYDDESGWIKYADSLGFALLLPEQRSGWWFGNHPLGCFNWFYRDDQVRRGGEAESIRQMIDRIIADQDLDPRRVYITGLSAGGAMTAVMLATYPDYFAGGAIIAGVAYGCSSVPSYVPLAAASYLSYWLSYTDPLRCMKPGVDHTPAEWADAVEAASPPGPTRQPRVSIWHGTADDTVAVDNALELVEQWTAVHGTDADADVIDIVDGHSHHVFHDAGGEAAVELFLVNRAGHGTPVNTGAETPSAEQCGVVTDFFIPAGICASFHIARFWGLAPP